MKTNPYCHTCYGVGYVDVYTPDGHGGEVLQQKKCYSCYRCRNCGCYPNDPMGPAQLCKDCVCKLEATALKCINHVIAALQRPVRTPVTKSQK